MLFRGAARFWSITAAVLLLSRLAHRNVLWADEDYHLAVAIQMLHGKMPYRDLWYDKPPLTALLDLAFGGWYGVPLRIACTVWALAVCWLGYRVAGRLWTAREGYVAAALAAFFQIFYLAPAVMPLEPDTLLMLPALGAVLLAIEAKTSKRAFGAGAVAGLGLLLTPKGIFALLPCLLFVGRAQWFALLTGFAAPNLAFAAWLWRAGALAGYWQQVWQWGWLYVSKPGNDPQARRGGIAVLAWLGFHAALLLAAARYWLRDKDDPWRWRLGAWAFLGLVAASVGGRFAPRYFMLLMIALAIPAARGLVQAATGGLPAPPAWAWRGALALALLVPLVRFGPRYLALALEDLRGRPHAWQDVAMNLESRLAADVVNRVKSPGDTIFVWGYRPDIIVYTRLPVASKFWDSQPVTGVPADRHLADSRSIAPSWAVSNMVQLARTRPAFIVDGLSAYNPQMSIARYGAVLQPWSSNYCLEARDERMLIYRLCSGGRR
jgi:4-amino-4-deoxy-L-arabinose transferase-like glycosyltransferase